MEITFLVLLSFQHVTHDAVDCVSVLASYFYTVYFTDELQVSLVAIAEN